jgi:hypothetical protein
MIRVKKGRGVLSCCIVCSVLVERQVDRKRLDSRRGTPDRKFDTQRTSYCTTSHAHTSAVSDFQTRILS